MGGWVGSLMFSNFPSVGMHPVTPVPELYQTWNSRQAGTVCFLHSQLSARPIITVLNIKIMRRKKQLFLIWYPFHTLHAVNLIPLAG